MKADADWSKCAIEPLESIYLLKKQVNHLTHQLAYACGYISGQPKWQDKTANDVRDWIESEVERINKRDKE